MSLNPSVWGPHAWIFLYSIALSYPECPNNIEKKNIKKFMANVGNVLPCHNCRDNFKRHTIKHTLTNKCITSRKNLVLWLLKINNEVNNETGKKQVSYDEVMKKYSDLYKIKKKKKSNNTTLILLGLLIVVIVITIAIQIIKKRNLNIQ